LVSEWANSAAVGTDDLLRIEMSYLIATFRLQTVKPGSRQRDSATVGGHVSVTGWLQGLEDRVERLETWAGPGQIEALAEGQQAIRTDIAKLQVTVNRHEKLLVRIARDVGTLKGDVGTLKGDVGTLKGDVGTLKGDVGTLKGDVGTLKADVDTLKGDVAVLKTDVAVLKTDVAVLKTDVGTLKTDVDTLKGDVAVLKTDVAVLKTDVAGLKQDMGEVKETLREILRRLPEHPSPN
jgi:outer membrane murein-binding lipoprotein Lpp